MTEHEAIGAVIDEMYDMISGPAGPRDWSRQANCFLPEARQVNFLQKMMDALAEKMAFPPVLAPEELEGEIDPNAHGVTYFSRDLASGGSLPKEWMTQGRYDVGLQRIQERQKAINEAFHTDLFQMFAQIQKQMTAREVAERVPNVARERLDPSGAADVAGLFLEGCDVPEFALRGVACFCLGHTARHESLGGAAEMGLHLGAHLGLDGATTED